MRRLSAELMSTALVGRRNGMGGKLYLLFIVIAILFSIFAETPN
jgi:hypothetical protein